MEDFAEPVQQPSTDLRQYLWLLWQWGWFIALAGILAASGALILSLLQTPIYAASTTILVNEARSGQYYDSTAIILTNEKLTRTYAEMMTKRPLLVKVAQKLNLPYVIDTVKVTPVRDTQLMQVTVEDINPVYASDFANELVNAFAEQLQEMQISRFKASKENLQNQLSYLEQQIQENSSALEKILQENISEVKRTNPDAANGTLSNTTIENLARQINQAEIDRLETRLAQYRQIYASVLASYEQIRLAEAQNITSIIQVEPATPPEEPVRPQTLRNTALAALVGIFLAVGIVFALDFLDDTIKSPDWITTQTKLPVIGTIQTFDPKAGDPVALISPRSPVTESFRSLRTNVRYASVDHPLRVLLVTSPTPEDGKTTVAINLAVVIAQSGNRSVLIDADLRRPRIHKVLGLDNRQGLSGLFIQNPTTLNGALQQTRLEALKVLPSGGTPPTPSELLGSQKMKEILDSIASEAEMIVVDTPPVLSVTDAAVLSPLVDGMLLVVKMGTTKQSALLQAVEQLQQVNARILGVVVNGVNPKKSHYYYRNYGYYQYYYYGDNGNLKKKRKTAVSEPGSQPVTSINPPSKPTSR